MSKEIMYLKGVGPNRAAAYKKLGCEVVSDLLSFYPYRYIDLRAPKSLSEGAYDENTPYLLTVKSKSASKKSARGNTLLKLFAIDKNGEGAQVVFFNRKFIFDKLEIDKDYIFYGKAVSSFSGNNITSPEIYDVTEQTILPVYHKAAGLTDRVIAKNVKTALLDYQPKEVIPEDLNSYMFTKKQAVSAIHFPSSADELLRAKNYLVFEEILIFVISLLRLRILRNKLDTVRCDDIDLSPFIDALPFTLTDSQTSAIAEIESDLKSEKTMSRLLLGDVGSGKTAVCAAAIYIAAKSGHQSVMMVPSEVLAKQHFATLESLLSPLGKEVVLLTASLKASERRAAKEALSNGRALVAVGTHSVISKDIVYKDLALVITDEQHRFGVNQRGELWSKGVVPHFLAVSATPIPRSLALVLYGDLDVSRLNTVPKGRKAIKTHIVPQKKQADMYGFIRNEIEKGGRCYIVCPLIEGSEDDERTSVMAMEKIVSSSALKGIPTATLHGKMKTADKDEAMRKFKDGEVKVLIATTVIEVGVDVSAANVIVINGAERFGLGTLHQLRGRVGRGEKQSFCFLLKNSGGESSNHRLKVLCETTDGFLLAEEDLKTRGPGQFFGKNQSGEATFKIANLTEDKEIVERAKEAAKSILEEDFSLASYPNLKEAILPLFLSEDYIVV